MSDLPKKIYIWYGNFNKQFKANGKTFQSLRTLSHIIIESSSSNDRMTRMKLQGQNPAAENIYTTAATTHDFFFALQLQIV